MIYIIYLMFTFILSYNLRLLKLFIIISIFFLILVGFSFFQNFIINIFYHKNNINELSIEKKYSIVILGGNYFNRVNLACTIVDKFNIKNILLIKDKYEKNNINSKKIESICFHQIQILSNKNNVVSTKEDLEILKKNIHLLSNNIIVITDNFHVKRVKYLTRNINKNFSFYSYDIIPSLYYENNYSISRGLLIVKITLKEIIATYFEKINDF